MITIDLNVSQERISETGTTVTQYFVVNYRIDKVLYIYRDYDTAYCDLFATVNVKHPSIMWGSQEEINSDIINIIKKALESREDVEVNETGVLFIK